MEQIPADPLLVAGDDDFAEYERLLSEMNAEILDCG